MKNVFKLLFYELKFRNSILKASISTFLFKLFDIIPEIIFGLILDLAIRKKNSLLFQFHFFENTWNIFLLGLFAFLIFLLGAIFQYLSSKQWKLAASSIQLYLRMQLCQYILYKDNHIEEPSKEILRDNERSLNRSIEVIEYFIGNTIEDFLKLIFSVLIIGPILFFIAPFFLFYAIFSLIPVFLLAILFQNKIRHLFQNTRNKMFFLCREFNELISGIYVVKDYALENRFYIKIKEHADALQKSYINSNNINSLIILVTRVCIQIGIIVILVHGAVLLINGKISIGLFTAASFLSRKFLLPFSFFATIFDKLIKGIDSLDEVYKKLIKKEIYLPKEIKSKNVKPLIEINMKKNFYSFENRKVLSQINSEFKKEQLNVIKGPTGSGKTTLLRLLLNDFVLDEGKIFNDVNDNQKNKEVIKRKNVAFVHQIPILFNASIRDNITLFDKNINENSLKNALEISLANEFINQLPFGINSLVGSNGIQLSGGQIQSIALARAFYSEAKIFLLDEPTSGFDSEREQKFLENLRKNLRDKVIIMTSHRSQSILAADYLYNMPVNSFKESIKI